ncbi:MAG: alpha/beta hydrolase [Actinomycetota bacterium]|nr:alpha/beta hydrolase [Actinomycetota bacterium]
MTIQHLDVGPLRFPAKVEGPEDGSVVFLLHGWPQTPDAWDAFLPAVAGGGHRVVAPWQRGYAPGARPTSIADYRLDRLVEDVLGMADVLGAERFDVVGHDWGGAVAWALAAQHPDRVRTITSLSTPHPAAMLASLPRSAQALRSAYIPVFQLPWLPERLLLAGGGGVLRTMLQRSGLDEARTAAYVEAMREPGALTAALSWYRAASASPSRLRAVGRIQVPTLFVWGSADPALGRTAAEGTAAQVDASYRFVPLEGAGHWLPERHSGDVVPPLLSHLATG